MEYSVTVLSQSHEQIETYINNNLFTYQSQENCLNNNICRSLFNYDYASAFKNKYD